MVWRTILVQIIRLIPRLLRTLDGQLLLSAGGWGAGILNTDCDTGVPMLHGQISMNQNHSKLGNFLSSKNFNLVFADLLNLQSNETEFGGLSPKTQFPRHNFLKQ